MAVFTAGQAATVDLAPYIRGYAAARTRVRIRADLAGPQEARPNALELSSQFHEFTLDGSRLHFDGSGAGSRFGGASAARVQVEVSNDGFDRASAVTVSDVAVIRVDAGAARIRYGLDDWSSFDELSRTVQGSAPAGAAPSGRTDLIGQTFDVSPGMLSEAMPGPGNGRGAPVARIQFPCTIRALDPRRPPVFRSVTGRRDVIQVEASLLAPIDGEVCLQDLVIRDNRAWYDSGEAGVRIKDRFAGRSVRLQRCEFIRCQNAVSGGGPGQTLRIHDCRIVDCGFGTQAHSLYVSPGWLEFFGNVVTMTPGNGLARAHLLKSRAAHARIFGNHFSLPQTAASFLIDLSNGGDVEIAGNELLYGALSDNSAATMISYAPEGALATACSGCDATSRRYRLVVRNNSFVSTFPDQTRFLVVDRHTLPSPLAATTWPEPLQVLDNVFATTGQGTWVTRRERNGNTVLSANVSSQFPANTARHGGPGRTPMNAAGPFKARRFQAGSAIGTGSSEHLFVHQGG